MENLLAFLVVLLLQRQVPEPATIALLAVGLGGLLAARKKLRG